MLYTDGCQKAYFGLVNDRVTVICEDPQAKDEACGFFAALIPLNYLGQGY
ncbi:MAG: hypothetical protein IPJ48_20600 [Propionivibrio sp.]|uniref:Uncharacterized protein n=1 Tax=Candidatus Propionivibrio dominans TaxID=2954373 RepID=A0A9D7FHJ7_9RHOO|nr:hypothetical protein [Candidatus Propionivibrio dominans]